jgi:hypothetical protein
MRFARIAALAALALALGAFAGVAKPDAAAADEPATAAAANGITVTGTGTVTSVPDRGQFTFGVVAQGRTASQALAATRAGSAKVVAALRGAGLAAADIQTQQLAVYQRHNEKGEPNGYASEVSVVARLRDLDRSGPVIDAAVAAGANNVYGPSLSRADETELYRQALRVAIANAKANAQAVAGASGLTLGRIVRVVEQGASPPVVMEAVGGSRMSVADKAVEPGTSETRALVVVTFATT